MGREKHETLGVSTSGAGLDLLVEATRGGELNTVEGSTGAPRNHRVFGYDDVSGAFYSSFMAKIASRISAHGVPVFSCSFLTKADMRGWSFLQGCGP